MMLTVKVVYVLLSIYISFCFAFDRSSQLGILCDYEGNCEWIPKTLYTGCLPADMSELRFIYFDSSSYLDLSCTSVQVFNIKSSELTCNIMSSLLTTSREVSLQLGDNSCIPPTSHGSSKNAHTTNTPVSSSEHVSTHESSKNAHTTSTPAVSSSEHVSTHESTKNAHTTSTPMSTFQHPSTHETTKNAHTTSTPVSTSQHLPTTLETTDKTMNGDTTPPSADTTASTSSTVTILIIISICLSAATCCGCLCWLLVRCFIRKRIQQEHIENIESVLSNYSIADSDDTSL